MCNMCKQQLLSYYSFRKQCKASEKSLKNTELNFELKSPYFINVEKCETNDNSYLSFDSHLKEEPDEIFDLKETVTMDLKPDKVNKKELKAVENEGGVRIIKRRKKRRTKEQMAADRLNRRQYRVRGKDLPALDTMLPEEYVNNKEILEENQCRICQKVLANKYILRNHIELHKSSAEYSCNVCDAKYKTFRSYECHMKTHDANRCLSCEYCGKLFTQPGLLEYHIQTHTGERLFQCDLCEKAFFSKRLLRVSLFIIDILTNY